jgi:transposase
MKRSRRKFTAEFKAKVSLAAVKGDRTLSELAAQFDIHPNQITMWKKQLIENVSVLFAKDPAERGDSEVQIKELHAKIGQLTMERDFLANGLGRVFGPNGKR